MIFYNWNLFWIFTTSVSPALKYPNKVFRYSAVQKIILDQNWL